MNERSSRSHGEVASTLLFQVPERKWSHGMKLNHLSSHTIALFGNYTFIQFAKRAKTGKTTLSSSMAMYLVIAWHTWCQEGYQWKEDELLFICYMQIFKSIDIRTMGLGIWITSFVYMKSLFAKTDKSIFVKLRYLRSKLLKYKENNKKISDTFDHNFKNNPWYIMSEVSC